MWMSSFKLLVVVGLSNHGSFLFTIFFEGSASIVDKLVMHPCLPFSNGALLTFLVNPSVYRAHRLKSTGVDY